MFPVAALLSIGEKVLDKVLPDPEARAKAQAMLEGPNPLNILVFRAFMSLSNPPNRRHREPAFLDIGIAPIHA